MSTKKHTTLACLATFSTFGLIVAAQPARAQDACSQQAMAALQSCRKQAMADYWLERAKCANLATTQEQTQCRAAALAALHDVLDDCDAQHAARLDLCGDLGGGNYLPAIDPNDFVPVIDNPYMTLLPGTARIYESHFGGATEHNEVRVTNDTKQILGVTCTVVLDTVWLDGVLSERTLDWFAQDVDGNVWYFGEFATQYEDGMLADIEGSWKAGVDGAHPGIVMEADPQVDDVYRQEYLIGTAEDAANVLSLSAPASVPYGTFPHCLKTEDFSPLEPDAIEQKYYVPGIGLVLEVDLDTGQRSELIGVE